jgi:hypothetical protein
MGNQMFQYSFGKLIEKKRNIKVFFLCRKEEYKLSGFSGIKYIDISSPIPSFLLKIFIKFKLRYFEFLSCLDEISINSIPNFSLVTGYFQSSSILVQNKSFVRKLFMPINFDGLKSEVCTIHVRRGDYLSTIFPEINSKAIIPEVWFLMQFHDISIKYSPKKIQLIGDDKIFLSSFSKKLDNSVECCFGSTMDDFFQLLKSKYLIISNSSFAWWGAFLNINEDVVVIAPKDWVGFNCGIEYPKGIMTPGFLWK